MTKRTVKPHTARRGDRRGALPTPATTDPMTIGTLRPFLGRFLRRLTWWRMPRAWWAFLVLGILGLGYCGAALADTLDESFVAPWRAVVPALALALFIGPIEELGWRGLAPPLVQRRFAPLSAGLILAVLVHFQMNNPIWPDIQPRDGLIFALAAVVIVALNRARLLRRDGAATDALAPAADPTVHRS